jgi:hypothetical protein
MVMPAKPVSTAARETAPFLLTAVKWVRAVRVQVVLHVTLRLGSETHQILATCFHIISGNQECHLISVNFYTYLISSKSVPRKYFGTKITTTFCYQPFFFDSISLR